MKLETIKLTCLSFACLVGATTPAALAAPTANPYALIGQKNSFRLQPMVQVTIEAPRRSAKIGLQGLTTALGRRQALLKLILPGNVAEASVILGEGEQAGCVEVRQINESTGVVTVLNCGTTQFLFLNADSSAPQPSVRQ